MCEDHLLCYHETPVNMRTCSALYCCTCTLIEKQTLCMLRPANPNSRCQVLKALETKSKEEIEHERAREPLVEAIGDARVRKQIHDHRLGTLLQSRDTYAKTKK